MQHIETVTVGAGGAASITFSAIPDTFTDLLLVVSPRNSGANTVDGLFMQFNGSTSGYSARDLYGTGTAAASSTNPYGRTNAAFLGSHAGSSATASTFGNVQCYIPSYTSAVAKSMSTDSVMETNATAANMDMLAKLWTGTDPISSINIFWHSANNWAQYSSASLYGVLAGSDGIVSVS